MTEYKCLRSDILKIYVTKLDKSYNPLFDKPSV